MAAMRTDRWAKLLEDAAIHDKATEVATYVKLALVAAMELRAKLRAVGGVDAESGERELAEVCEHLEMQLAYAMNRLPQSKKREIVREIEGAAQTASARKAGR